MLSYNYCKWLCAWRAFETDWEFTLNVLQLWEPQFPPLCLYLLCTFATLIQWATFLFLIFCFVTQNHFSHLQEFSPPHDAFFVINFLTFIPTCLLTGSCHILSRILALFTWSKREMHVWIRTTSITSVFDVIISNKQFLLRVCALRSMLFVGLLAVGPAAIPNEWSGCLESISYKEIPCSA